MNKNEEFFFAMVIFNSSLVNILGVNSILKQQQKPKKGRINKDGETKAGRVTLYKGIDEIQIINIQDNIEYLEPQEILCYDGASVEVKALIKYQIVNTVKSVINIKDCVKSTKLITGCLLRDKIGFNTFQQVLCEKEAYQTQIEVCF